VAAASAAQDIPQFHSPPMALTGNPMPDTTKINGTAKRSAHTHLPTPAELAPVRLSASERREEELSHAEYRHEKIRLEFNQRAKSRFHARRDRSLDMDLIIHAAAFQPGCRIGGVFACSILSPQGLQDCVGSFQFADATLLGIHCLTAALHDIRRTPGRVTVYTTGEMQAFHLNHRELASWREQEGCDLLGSPVPHAASWFLLQDLFEERQGSITHVEPGSSPAIRYCERMARMCYDSKRWYPYPREEVLRSLAKD